MVHSHHMHREHQVSHRRVHKILEHEPDGAKHHHKSHAFSKVTSKTAAEHHDHKVSGHKAPKRYARGGKVHPDEAEDKKLIKTMIHKHDAGKFARGGKTKGGKHGHQTNIAIVVPGAKHPGAAPGGPAGMPPMAGAGPMGPPPGAGPGGPPMPPPGAGGPPGMPPGMPMRARGGMICKADGGATPLQPRGIVGPGKREQADAARNTREILEQRGLVTPSKNRGGSIDGESSKANIKSWEKRSKHNSYARGGITAGAESGVGRLQKAHHRVKK